MEFLVGGKQCAVTTDSSQFPPACRYSLSPQPPRPHTHTHTHRHTHTLTHTPWHVLPGRAVSEMMDQRASALPGGACISTFMGSWALGLTLPAGHDVLLPVCLLYCLPSISSGESPTPAPPPQTHTHTYPHTLKKHT